MTTDTITLPEAALKLGVSHGSAYTMMLRGELPGVKAGHRWVVSKEAVERMAAERDPEPLQAA